MNSGRMPPSEFHRRKADVMESLAVGIDDGKTRTSGEYLNTKTMVLILYITEVIIGIIGSLPNFYNPQFI